MGEVIIDITSASDVLAYLRGANPSMRVEILARYADAYVQYREASENIGRCGAITAHPRTGAPLENPYLKIRDAASKVMAELGASRLGRIVCPGLWP